MRWRSLGVCLVGTVLVSPDVQAATCESLRTLRLPNATIMFVEPVGAGAFVRPADAASPPPQTAAFEQLPAFCRVAATLRPSSDSDIRIEVWMPLANWNGKFQGVGNGGFAGSITYTSGRGGIERGMAEALARGYATASTDTGHVGGTAAPFLGHPETLIDYGYRAVHEMTVAAKAMVDAFYGAPPRFSYWNGCSLGGRQGLMEAQRFPADYDGIIAGAPANPQTRLSVWNVHVGKLAARPTHAIPASKYPMIHTAVVNACDASDGLQDGQIGDPSACRFDFGALACTEGDSPSCLTPGQIETARTVTTPAVHSKTGELIFPGLALGTELGWATKIGGREPSALGTEFLKYVVYKDANWDWRTFDFESAVVLADRLDQGTVNVSADLRAFRQRGGRLLLYHGWRDQNFSAESTINYYGSVRSTVADPGTDDWMRLFLAPGVGHCGGGEGPNAFDVVAAMEQWVEHGKAPSQVIATRRTDGKVVRTRPLCPYPQVAKYRGTGNIDDAANFACVAP